MQSNSIAAPVLLAPNGRPSNLSPAQYALVRTPAFVAWFGDWEKLARVKFYDSGIDDVTLANLSKNVSKVVDENGEPLVVYRGDKEHMGYEFKLGLNLLAKPNVNDFGFFFASDYKVAELYMNRDMWGELISGSVMSVFIKANKVLDISDLGHLVGGEQLIKKLKSSGVDFNGFDKLESDVVGYNAIDYNKNDMDMYGYNTFDYFDLFPDLRKVLMSNGVGSIIFSETSRSHFPYKVYVAFEPSQIKLADGSNTTFDASNPDIRFGSGGAVTTKNLAPNGKPSNLTPKQWHLVRTPEFISWFGDWINSPETASKVVDENGEPLVVYHGTKNQFNTFEKSKRGSNTDAGIFGKGFYFSKNINTSKGYGNYIKEVFLNLSNPFNNSSFQNKSELAQHLEIDEDILKEGGTGISAYLSYTGIFSDAIKEKGYDGVTTKYGEFVSFEPSQIKLADGSNTTFDASNPDIRLGSGGVVTTKNLAPNRKPSNLTPKQWHLVRTPEFISWFGDWINSPETASKVVDENGEPMVCYHGTGSEFYVFDLSKVGSRQSNDFGMWGRGFYFSPIKKFSQAYGDKIMRVFLSIQNPFIITPTSKLPIEFKPVNGKENSDALRERFINNGYNGVIQYESGQKPKLTQLIAFYPNQIKLADGSNTTFDASNPDIRFDRGGSVNVYQNWQLIDSSPHKTFTVRRAKYKNKISGLIINVLHSDFGGGARGGEPYSAVWENEKYIEPKKFRTSDNVKKCSDYLRKKYGIIHIASNLERYRPKKYDSGGSVDSDVNVSKTPAPKSDRVYGSKTNEPKSAESANSAKEIQLSDSVVLSIENKLKEHNHKNADKKISLAVGKAVVRRGMGAYSSTHRPTISGGSPNSRVAWGLARLNAFIYKAEHGKSKSGKYHQDDDLLSDLKIKHESYEAGGQILYHGSKAAFDKFDENKVSSGESGDLFGKGFYLTDNRDVADFYAHHVSKKEFVDRYTPTGIFGSDEPVYKKGAEESAAAMKVVNVFNVDGKFLDAENYIIDEKFEKYIYDLADRVSEFGSESAIRAFKFMRENKSKIYQYRGELWYIITQVGMGMSEFVEGIVEYIKGMGYDGVKYPSDKSYEGDGSYNYVVYNPSVIEKIKEMQRGGDVAAPEISEEAQMYIDILSDNPNTPSYQRYKHILKEEFGIDFDELYKNKDASYIENATLEDIKSKEDFLSFDNWMKYAKKICELRGYISPLAFDSGHQIEITDDVVNRFAKEFDFEVNKVPYEERHTGSGDIARVSGNTLVYTEYMDGYYFIHELGHLFNFKYSQDGSFAYSAAYSPTSYGSSNTAEAFAESFAAYFLAPEELMRTLPMVYAYLDDAIPENWKAAITGLISSKPVAMAAGGAVERPKDLDVDLGVRFGQKFPNGDIIVAHSTSSNLLGKIYKHGLKNEASSVWENTSGGKLFFEVEPTATHYGDNVYGWKAVQKYGGLPVTLYVRVNKNLLTTDTDDADLGAAYRKNQKQCECDISPENIIGLRAIGLDIKRADFKKFAAFFNDRKRMEDGGKVDAGSFMNMNASDFELAYTDYEFDGNGVVNHDAPADSFEQDSWAKGGSVNPILEKYNGVSSPKYWMIGGKCLLFAIAFQRVYGGRLYDVVEPTEHSFLKYNGNVHHVVVKINSEYFDASGKYSERELLDTWNSKAAENNYKLDVPFVIEPHNRRRALDMKYRVLNPEIDRAEKVIVMEQSQLVQLKKGGDLSDGYEQMIHSPEFLAWFGNWVDSPETASKVVDESGKPKIVYHGSDKKFNTFDKARQVDGQHGKAFYFGDLNYAESYYGKDFRPFFLRAVNLFDMFGSYSLEEIKLIFGDRYSEVSEMIDEEMKYAFEGKIGGYLFYSALGNDALRKAGYDGIKHEFVYVVFEPEQIKLADGRNRTFDISSPDVRYEKGGDIPKPPTEKELEERWDKKKDHVMMLASNMRKLRYNVTRDLKSEKEKIRLAALVIAVMDKSAERVGGEESAEEGHFGVTGFKKSHVKIDGNTISLNYVGKSGVDHEKSFSDETIANALRDAIKNSPDEFIFTTTEGFKIKAAQINNYLSDYDGCTAKDIRGFKSNDFIIEKLKRTDISKDEDERVKQFREAVKFAAEKVGHGAAILKKHYMIPELERKFIKQGKLLELSDFYKTGGLVKMERGGHVAYEEINSSNGLPDEPYQGDAAAGVYLVSSKTGRGLLCERSTICSEAGAWAFVGGEIDEGETPRAAVIREVEEELGYKLTAPLHLAFIYEDDGFRYYNFIAVIEDEFEPILNNEHTDHKWTAIDELPQPLHFGAVEFFDKVDVPSEIKAAKAIVMENGGGFVADTIRQVAKEKGIMVHGDYIYLYHGTSPKNWRAILKSGMFKSGTWFAGDEATARQYGRQGISRGEEVLTLAGLYIPSLAYNGYFTTQQDLFYGNGVYSPKAKKMADGGSFDSYKEVYKGDGSLSRPYDLRMQFPNVLFGGSPSDKEVKDFSKWLYGNKDKYVVVFHGSPRSAKESILKNGILPTSEKRRHSQQSSSGYTYVTIFPTMARQFADFGSPPINGENDVWEIGIQIRWLLPDRDQLRNQRVFADKDVSDSLADSLIYGHGARVKGRVDRNMIRLVDKGDPQHFNLGGALGEEAVTCDNCEWSWAIKDSHVDDMYVCHQCGYDNSPVANEFEKGGSIPLGKWKMPSKEILAYAEEIKTKFPKVWALGGNVFGNTAYKMLKHVIKRGHWNQDEEWFYKKWQAFMARHAGDKLIAGVIANLKWLAWVNRGKRYSKDVIKLSVEKIYPSQKMELGGLFHGSAFKFDKFDLCKLGTGEGNVSFGWGLYFTEVEDIAKFYGAIADINNFYIDGVALKDIDLPQPAKHAIISFYNEAAQEDYEGQALIDEVLYQLNIRSLPMGKEERDFMDEETINELNEAAEMYRQAYFLVDNNVSDKKIEVKSVVYSVSVHKGKSPKQYDYMRWDLPITDEQYEKIKSYSLKTNAGIAFEKLRHKTGEQVYYDLVDRLYFEKPASCFLLSAGIDGIKYPANSLHGERFPESEGKFNYTVFDDSEVVIEKVEQFAKGGSVEGEYLKLQRGQKREVESEWDFNSGSGQHGDGIYAFLYGDKAMQNYYSSQGETIYTFKVPKRLVYDLSYKNWDFWEAKAFMYNHPEYSVFIFRHVGAGIPSSKEVLVTDASIIEGIELDGRKLVKGGELSSDAAYRKWKRANVTYRGMQEVGKANSDRSGVLGSGLYTTPSSNKSMSRQYGGVYFVVNARPKNPKKFSTMNHWEIWYQRNLLTIYSKDGFPDLREFNKNSTIEKEMLKLGYDGIEIEGREIVNFTPVDVRYFKTEQELKNYYEHIQNN